jgi:serine/threonine protein kinase
MAEAAAKAWKRRFQGRRHIQLEKNEEPLFKPDPAENQLGRTSISEVHVTHFKGIPLALKRTFPRRKVTDFDLNEMQLLSQWSEDKHKHIVRLIGSFGYTEKRPGGSFDLFLLIWPVAKCNLETYLENVDLWGKWLTKRKRKESVSAEESREVESAVDLLVAILQPQDGPRMDTSRLGTSFYDSSIERVQRSFGCMAEAVAWLHKKNVRHKDLKPSQFLLSCEGLWLTDFGWSKDMSLEENSATEGYDRITCKYHSPERATMTEPCGKPEDIFALGCTFLQMAYRLSRPWKEDLTVPGLGQNGWMFCENLDQLPTWVKDLTSSAGTSERFRVAKLTARMMKRKPASRPRITDVLEELATGGRTKRSSTSESYDFFGSCCHSQCKQYGKLHASDLQSEAIAHSSTPRTQASRLNVAQASSTKRHGPSEVDRNYDSPAEHRRSGSAASSNHTRTTARQRQGETKRDDLQHNDRSPKRRPEPSPSSSNVAQRSKALQSQASRRSSTTRSPSPDGANVSQVFKDYLTTAVGQKLARQRSPKPPLIKRSSTGPSSQILRDRPSSPSKLGKTSSTEAMLSVFVPSRRGQRRSSASSLGYLSDEQGRRSSVGSTSELPTWRRDVYGDYWCSVEGCSARFLVASSFELHYEKEHPEERAPILKPHYIAKYSVTLPRDSQSIWCDYKGCSNSYNGNYKEQSLVSHRKRKHNLLSYVHNNEVFSCDWRSLFAASE